MLLVTVSGCSIVGSVSNSVSSPFVSSSRLFESESAKYQGDVADYTETYVHQGGDMAKFKDGLGHLASSHGISNWEAERTTYVGIGEGLKKAGASAGQVEAYTTALAGSDAKNAAAIQEGYNAGK